MRRFTSILIFLFALFATVLWASERFEDTWEPALRARIETSASQALGVAVHVMRVRYRFPFSVQLVNVEAAPVFQADTITLHVNVLNIPFAILHHDVGRLLGFIDLQHPQVRMDAAQLQRFKHRRGGGTSAVSQAPFFGISLQNGLVEWENPQAVGHPWTLQHLDGVFQWRGPQQSLWLDARAPRVSSVHASYSALGQHWKATLSVTGLDIEKMIDQLDALHGAPLFPKGNGAAGAADVTVHLGGVGLPKTRAEWPAALRSARWNVANGKLFIQNLETPWESRGTVVGRRGILLLERANLNVGNSAWALSGTVRPDNDPILELQARCSAAKADVLAPLLHTKQILFGTGEWIVRLNGPVSALRLSIQALFADAELLHRPVKDLSALVRYADHQWTLLDSGFRMGTGRVRAQGTLSKDALDVHATAENAALDVLANQPALRGTLSAALELDGSLDNWDLRGSWWTTRAGWNQPWSADWRGTLEAQRDGGLVLNGDSTDNRYHLRAKADSGAAELKLTDAALDTPLGTIHAQGSARLADQRGHFTLQSDALAVQHQRIQRVTVDGDWNAPILVLHAHGTQHDTTNADPTDGTFAADIRYRPGRVTVEQAHYTRGAVNVAGSAGFVLGAAAIPFNGSAEIHAHGVRADTTIPLTFNGHVEPHAQGRGAARIVSGPATADLHWEQWDDVAMHVHLDKGGWNSLPFTGDLDGRWHPSVGSQLTLQGTVEPDGHLDASISVQGQRARIEHATFKTAESRLEVEPGGTVDFSLDKDIQATLSAKLRNLHLGFLTFFGSLDLDGRWSRGKDHPVVTVQAKTHSLFINDYELEEGRIVARWERGMLHFTPPDHGNGLIQGDVDFQQRPQLFFKQLQLTGKEGQRLSIDGEVGPTLWNYTLSGSGLDLGILGEIAGLPIPMSGSADLKVTGHGDAKHANVQGHTRIQQGRIGDLQYSSGETDFIWQEDRITFQNLRLQDNGRYSAIGGGVFPIRSKVHPNDPLPDINFTVQLQNTNLGFLQSLYPEIKSAHGDVDGLVQVQGTLDNPEFRGHLTVKDGDLTNAHYFRRLRDIQVAADFDRSRLRITTLRARSGNGAFQAGGTINLAGFMPSAFDLHLETLGSNIDVEVPELAIPDSPLAKRFKFLTSVSRVDAAGHVTFTGSADAPVFKGDVTLSNGHFTFPPSGKKTQPSDLALWARRIVWDVDLHFKDKAWFENELVEASIAGAFHIKGAADNLTVNGGVTTSQGNISYLGLQFTIHDARFDLKSGTPFLSCDADSQVEATNTVGLTGGVNTNQRYTIEDTVTLNIPYSPIDQIQPRLTSANNPSLPQEKVLARVTQLDVDNLTPEEKTYLYQQQAVSLIDNSLTTPLAQKILKKTGIADRFRAEHVFDPSAAPPVDPVTGQATRGTTAGDLLANTKYTLEKDVMNNLSVGYGVRFIPTTLASDPNARKLDLVSDLQLSYRAFRNVYVRGAYDLPSSDPGIVPDKRITIEPRWRFGWWGNTNPPKKATNAQ